jgi:hypothetical protein
MECGTRVVQLNLNCFRCKFGQWSVDFRPEISIQVFPIRFLKRFLKYFRTTRVEGGVYSSHFIVNEEDFTKVN